jgi:uncharacterized phiE125 gp8 family phage protein
MLKPVRTVAPTADLISLNDAKLHLRVDHSDDDTLISGLIAAAVAHLDGYSGVLGRALLTQTWKIEANAFDDPMRMPVGNLLAVTSVKYYDASNAQQTLATSVYGTFTDTLGPFVALKSNQSWPAIYTRRDAVEVIWTAGYGATAATVPVAIRHAALLIIGHWYENRSTISIGDSVAEMPMAATSLLEPYRLNRI